MSNLLTPDVLGQVSNLTNYNGNLDKIENSLGGFGYYALTGLVPSAGTGLSVNVTAGTALIAGLVTVAAPFSIGGLTPSTTNFLYLLQNGTGTSNTTGTAPANSVRLGTATTNATVVTAVDTNRTGGRQALVRTENLVLGGPAAGNPAALDLAGGTTVTGILPAGNLPATLAYTNANITLSDAVNIVLGTTTGTQLGTSSTQKLGFLGTTPKVRPAAYTLTGTVTRTFPADPTVAYTGAADSEAKLADLNTLRTTVSSLIGVVRQLQTDLGSTSGYGLLA